MMRKPLFYLFLVIGLIASSVCMSQEGAVAKKPMIEIFTSSTCPPCVLGNTVVDGILGNNPDQYSLVKYQMNWPGSGDPYYLDASGVRRDYYEVTGVPHIRSNGFSPGYPQNWTQALFNDLAGTTNISITAEASVNEMMEVSCHVEITAHAGYSSGLRAYIIVVEQNTFENATTNGETEFHNVVQAYMSGSEGIELGELATDQVDTFDLSLDLTGSFTETGNDLTLVVFVQDHASMDVKQSEMVEVSHPFTDYSANFNIYDVDYNQVDNGSMTVEMAGKASIKDSKATISKLFPGTYYYQIIVPGLLPYDGEFYITDSDVNEDVFIDIPPFLFYEDFEMSQMPSDWTVTNPQNDYFTLYGNRLVYQKLADDTNPVFLVMPKIAIDQGCVLSFKAGESSGPSNIAVGIVTNPQDPAASFNEIGSYEIFGFENMRALGARIDDPAIVGDGYLCFKILGDNGSFFYLDNVLVIENMPGYKVQFMVTDQNSEILPEVEINFMEQTLATNDFGYATWRDIDEAEYTYSVTYKGEEIETGTIDVYEDMVKEIVWNTSGIDQVKKDNIEVYPNPAVDKIYVKGVINGRLSIMDLEGRVLKNKELMNDTYVQIDDLRDGIYIIRIESKNKTKITKLVKTR